MSVSSPSVVSKENTANVNMQFVQCIQPNFFNPYGNYNLYKDFLLADMKKNAEKKKEGGIRKFTDSSIESEIDIDPNNANNFITQNTPNSPTIENTKP